MYGCGPRLKILKFRVSKYDWIECDGSFVQLAWLFVWKCLKVKDNDGFINLEAVAVDITFGVWCASKYSCFSVLASKHTYRVFVRINESSFLVFLFFPEKATSHPKKCPRRASIKDFPMFGPAPLAFLKDVWSTLEDLKWSKMLSCWWNQRFSTEASHPQTLGGHGISVGVVFRGVRPVRNLRVCFLGAQLKVRISFW